MKTQRRRLTMIALAMTALAGSIGCRVGGPSGDDSDAVDASVGVDAAPDAGPAPVEASPDSGPPIDPDAGPSDAAPPEDAGPTVTDGCVPTFTSKVCDPVCNTGCAALTRCDVSDNPNEGACIGIWISGEGTACWKTPTTDPCAEKLTCVDSKCRRLCWHDSDCAGACCKESISAGSQPSGFKVCAPCT